MRNILDRIGGQTYYVIGDLCLDHYLFGRPQRVSREAPVMVLDEEREESRLGGGAAPALALSKLGCNVAAGGVTGDDPEGQKVRDLLATNQIDLCGIITDPNRPTTTKTRVVASGFLLFPQQLVRVDRQDRSPVDGATARAIVDAIDQINPDAIIISDYRSGVVTDALITQLLAKRQDRQILLTVDSQGQLDRFPGFDLIKCNQAEAEAVLGESIHEAGTRQRLLQQLQQRLNAGCLVVTRGNEGAAIASKDDYAEVPAPSQREVFDVTGAGDTVVAIMTAALLAGATPVEATRLGQVAAGIVVRKWGNAQASRTEIEQEIDRDGTT